MKIPEVTDSPVLNIALDTIQIKKQALVFCNTKRGAESIAEKISLKIKDTDLAELSNQVLKVLSNPTKQCRRLALCVRKGIAFHHAGLPAGQRKIIEDKFREGVIKVICSTPTLAWGINMPAFRAVMKDLKRYGGRWGMNWIPTLEYHQMAGRAGRPDFNDKSGEAICIAGSDPETEEILERFIYAGPENILSKLAVEPVLRTHCLNLISSGYAASKTELIDFFKLTFYGHQFQDMVELEFILTKILGLLEEWGFIRMESDDFTSANELGQDKVRATALGRRVSELYLDPYTAHYIITALRRATQKITNEFSYLSMVCGTLELRPAFTVRVREVPLVENYLSENSSDLIVLEPSMFEHEYDDFLKSIKTTLVLQEYMDEKDEDYLLEAFNVRPGEFRAKLEIADWLFYAADELCKILGFMDLLKNIRKTRFRLKHGIKEELIPLVKIKGVGRKRARKLYRNGIRDIGDLKKADIATLGQLIGQGTAASLKKDLGQEVKEIKPNKRKGQKNVMDYRNSK